MKPMVFGRITWCLLFGGGLFATTLGCSAQKSLVLETSSGQDAIQAQEDAIQAQEDAIQAQEDALQTEDLGYLDPSLGLVSSLPSLTECSVVKRSQHQLGVVHVTSCSADVGGGATEIIEVNVVSIDCQEQDVLDRISSWATQDQIDRIIAHYRAKKHLCELEHPNLESGDVVVLTPKNGSVVYSWNSRPNLYFAYGYDIRKSDAGGIADNPSGDASVRVLSQGELPVANKNSKGQIGLGGLSYWSRGLVWKDLFLRTSVVGYRHGKQSIDPKGAEFDAGFSLRKDGYPATIAPGYSVMWLIVDGLHETDLVVLYDGTGKIKPFGATVVENSPGREVWHAASNRLGLIIEETSASNPIRNIRVVEKRFENNYLLEPLYPEFVADFKRYRLFRFMNALMINGSKVSTVADLSKPGDAISRGVGMPIEHIVQVCNVMMSDCWINIPAMADDGYVREVAKTVKKHLDPRLKIYVEYGNETWNAAGSFAVGFYYGADQGAKLQCNVPDYKNEYSLQPCNTHQYTAIRSLEMWKIFDDVIGKDHIVHLMPGQVVSSWTYKQRLDVGVPVSFASGLVTPRNYADAISGTNYYGDNPKKADISDKSFDGTNKENWISLGLNALQSGAWGDSYSGTGRLDNFIQIAGDLPIVQYEGGLAWALGISSQQAIRATFPENPDAEKQWTSGLIQACKDPRMYKMTKDFTSAFMNYSDKIYMFSQFTATGMLSKYGCWPIVDDNNLFSVPDRTATRYRFNALNDWIDENRLDNKAPRIFVARVSDSLVATVKDDNVKQIGRIAISWIAEGVKQRGDKIKLSDIPANVNKIKVYANDGWAIGVVELEITR